MADFEVCTDPFWVSKGTCPFGGVWGETPLGFGETPQHLMLPPEWRKPEGKHTHPKVCTNLYYRVCTQK